MATIDSDVVVDDDDDEREPGIGAEAFAEGNWYHELLEDGLALSYRVRVRTDDDASRRRRRHRCDSFGRRTICTGDRRFCFARSRTRRARRRREHARGENSMSFEEYAIRRARDGGAGDDE